MGALFFFSLVPSLPRWIGESERAGVPYVFDGSRGGDPVVVRGKNKQTLLSPCIFLSSTGSSIVDERDLASVMNAIFQVLEQGPGSGGGGSSGSLIHLRVTNGLVSCDASMSIVLGSQGLIVVTRLYNW